MQASQQLHRYFKVLPNREGRNAVLKPMGKRHTLRPSSPPHYDSRQRNQPLTEPAVSPLMTCWLSIKYKINVGKTARQTAANVGPHWTWPYCPLKFNSPT